MVKTIEYVIAAGVWIVGLAIAARVAWWICTASITKTRTVRAERDQRAAQRWINQNRHVIRKKYR